MESADLYSKNVAKLAELFPNCITETADEDGGVKFAVDFDKLRQNLADSGDLAQGPEAYDFTWVGKRAALAEAYKPIRKTLRPCPEESVDWDNTQNLYIEGDNLDVLKLLQESYLGKVNVIYIDPPYNTGNDFIYNDNFSISSDDYDLELGCVDEIGTKYFKNNSTNGRYHSDWCSMIYSRLLIARNLLCEDGVIFISIDDKELENLKKICNEIFGKGNGLGCLTWVKKTKPINSGNAKFQLQSRLEYVLVYCKGKNTPETYRFHLVTQGERQYNFKTEKGFCRLKDIEDSDYGTKSRETMKFPILGVKPSTGKRWKIGKKEVECLVAEDKIRVINGKIKVLIYPNDESSEICKPFWSHLETVGSAEDGKKELVKLLGSNIGFDTVKPVDLLTELLKHFDKDILVMDFFSGSATTAHAVIRQNIEDEGKRKFILVQVPERCLANSDAFKAGYKNICEIGKERIRRAGKKIREESGGTDLDIGFRVLKVDDSNMKPVFYGAQDMEQSLLDATLSNIKEDRAGLDLLFGCLLDWGLPLSLPYKEETIEGKSFLNYADGELMACFDDELTETVMKEVAKRRPTRVVFRDSCFKDSATKINLAEIFKLYSPETTIKTL